MRFETLDAWRGICALLVAIMHFPASGPIAESALVRNAWLFVDFFFVLSGFVIAHSYSTKIFDGPSFARFAILRLGRIYPLHLATLAAFVLYEALRWTMPGLNSNGAPAFTGQTSLSALLSNIFLLNGTGLEDAPTWNSPSWSISSEFWTYLLFGLLVLTLRRRYWLALLPALLICPAVIFNFAPRMMDSTYDFGLVRCIYGFSAGALLHTLLSPGTLGARSSASGRERVFVAAAWTLAEVATVTATVVFVSRLGQHYASLSAPFVFAFAVYVFAHEAGLLSRLLRTPPLAMIGRLSFSIYLVHILVQGRMFNLATLAERAGAPSLTGSFTAGGMELYGFGTNGPLFGTLMFAAMIATVLLVAWIAHHFVEEPMRRLSRRLAAAIPGDDRRLMPVSRQQTVNSRPMTSPVPVQPNVLLQVQYLRVAAAMAVFYYHISASMRSNWESAQLAIDAVGAAGVDLFFVLSGFIMAKIVAEGGARDPVLFIKRRMVRIVPLYWALTLLVFALALAVPSVFNRVPADIGHLVHSLLFLPYIRGSVPMSPVVTVGWTLNYEIFFYVLVAVCASFLKDQKLVIVRLLIVGLVLYGIALAPENHIVRYYTDPIILEFAFGIAIYAMWRDSKGLSDHWIYPVLLVIGIGVLVAQFESDAGNMRLVYWGIPSALILLGALHAIRFKSPMLMRVADWSYALYLTHYMVIAAFVKFFIPLAGPLKLPWQLHYVVMTCVAIAVAAVTHVVIERHARVWLGRALFHKRRLPAALGRNLARYPDS
jgi:peptidoglycan/LPS O-acetylase OafA/YrhL